MKLGVRWVKLILEKYERWYRMNIEIKKITDLNLYKNNPRKHTRNQVDMIKKSIKQFGFIVPVLIDEDNVIITGHGRIKAAEQLSMTEVPTIQISHLTEKQVKAFRIADNFLTDESGWEKDMLKIEFADIDIIEFDILKPLDLDIAATEIQLDHNVDDEDSGGAYFQTANEMFIQIGSVSFTVEQTDDTKKSLEILKSIPDKKGIGEVIIQTILDYKVE